MKKYPNINAICITCLASLIRLDDEKKVLFNKIIDFFGKNFYSNVLFIMTFSDSEPNFEGLKLFKKDKKRFVDTYLKEPWCFIFYLNSTFSEEKNNNLIKNNYMDDYKMSNSFLEKIKKLPHQKYISNKREKKYINDINELHCNFFRCFKFFFEKMCLEIYKINSILFQIMNTQSSEIKFPIINIDLVKSSHENLLCEDCKCTCYNNYNGICFFCSNNCKHIIAKLEYKINHNEISMTIEDFFKHYNQKRQYDNLNKINILNYNLRNVLLNKFYEMISNIKSKNIIFEYPFDKLIKDIKKSISKDINYPYYNLITDEMNTLYAVIKLQRINNI